MNDFATLTRQPRPLTVGDRTYQLHPFSFDDLGKLQAWIDAQFPDPMEICGQRIAKGKPTYNHVTGQWGIDKFSIAEQQYMWGKAIELASRPRAKFGSDAASEVLATVDGMAQMLYLSVVKGDPTFTIDRARELIPLIGGDGAATIYAATQAAPVIGDPKSTGPSGNPTPGPSEI